MELRLVADTNLFLECKPLEQLPWEDLRQDTVAVLLTKPVLDELDKHKHATGRTRTRALEILGLVRSMLEADRHEIEIRPASPRVVLRRTPSVKPDPRLKDDLDYARTDERLVGIVSTLQADASGAALVKLFTNDLGPASTAADLGVPFLMIDASWRRPPPEGTEEKRIRELEKDLATYRAQEPRISIGSCENAGPTNLIEVRRRVAVALTEREVEEFIAALRAKHPEVTEFPSPPTSVETTATGETLRVEYSAPADEAVADYRNVAYPRWIESCRRALATLHEGRDEIDPPLVVRWPLTNLGTRPASQVRIEFEARGPLMLARLAAEDGDASEGVGETQAIPSPRLPSPPRPPSSRRTITRTPPPPVRRSVRQPPWMSAITAADVSALDYAGISGAFNALDQARLFPLARGLPGLGSVSDRARLLLDTMPGMAHASCASPPTDFGRLLAPRFSEPDHPEDFRWDWPMGRPVRKGALTCELWRHQTPEELFEFEVIFEEEGASRGTVECVVHAENLTTPERSRVIVGRVVESFALRDLADRLVDACE